MPTIRGQTTARRRKPRDLIISILMDQVEKLEGLRRAMTVDEAEFLCKVHRLLTEAQSTDAEVAVLEQYSTDELNDVHKRLTDLLEEEAKGSLN